MVGEADEPSPGHEVDGCQDEFQPGGVCREGTAWQVTQPGGFDFADAVLDSGVLAVTQLQTRDLPGHDASRGIGDECGNTHAVGVGEPQLCTGVGAVFTQDQPGCGGPSGQGDQVGGFGNPGALADTTVGVDRRVPAIAEVEDGVLDPSIDGVAEGEPHPSGAGMLRRNHRWPRRYRSAPTPPACRDHRDARGRAEVSPS